LPLRTGAGNEVGDRSPSRHRRLLGAGWDAQRGPDSARPV